jgi:4-amino-4-deoxy-L-arabinose transferase-like glycosyltransferase
MNVNNSSREPSRSSVLLTSAIAMLVCLFGHLGAMGLTGPDEPRYVWIARAMAETRDWVTPRLYGQPWFEKPVLYYWVAATGFFFHLPSEWAARLPSALAALATALAIGWLGWKHYGGGSKLPQNAAILAPLIFSTTVAAIGFARAATPDMVFSAAITLAMACAADVFRKAGALRGAYSTEVKGRPDTLALVLFGVFLGKAVLAKGPAAIVLAGGAIVIWALATKKWRVAFRLAHPVSLISFCAIALPWYAICARRNPEFLRVFILQHNFERYLTPMFQHKQPFWFSGPVVLVALLPWTVLLLPVAKEGLKIWREKSWSNSPGFFFACWAIFPLVFFSFSQSKLPSYILPAIPPLALLCSVAVMRAVKEDDFKTSAILSGVGLTWIALGVVGFYSLRRLARQTGEDSFRAIAIACLLSAAVFAALLIATSFSRKRGLIIPLCILFVSVSVEAANLQLLPILDPLYSARPYAQLMRNDQHPDRIFTYHVQRAWDYGLAFYLQRELPEWSPTDPEAALVLTSPQGLVEIRKLGRVSGALDEEYGGLLYVPIQRVPTPR